MLITWLLRGGKVLGVVKGGHHGRVRLVQARIVVLLRVELGRVMRKGIGMLLLLLQVSCKFAGCRNRRSCWVLRFDCNRLRRRLAVVDFIEKVALFRVFVLNLGISFFINSYWSLISQFSSKFSSLGLTAIFTWTLLIEKILFTNLSHTEAIEPGRNKDRFRPWCRSRWCSWPVAIAKSPVVEERLLPCLASKLAAKGPSLTRLRSLTGVAESGPCRFGWLGRNRCFPGQVEMPLSSLCCDDEKLLQVDKRLNYLGDSWHRRAGVASSKSHRLVVPLWTSSQSLSVDTLCFGSWCLPSLIWKSSFEQTKRETEPVLKLSLIWLKTYGV